jgi:undecaprenyl-diphosphatase
MSADLMMDSWPLGNRTKGWAGVLVAAAVVYSVLARMYGRFPGDTSLVVLAQRWQHPVVTAFMEAMSILGKSLCLLVMAGAAVLGLCLRRRRECRAAIGVLVVLALTPVLQTLVHRARPPADLVGENVHLTGLSYPSGHAFQSFVLFGFFIFLAAVLIKDVRIRRGVQALLAILIVAIGVSRVYLGAHWPSDVVGAHLLGAAFLTLLLRPQLATGPVVGS